MEIPNFTAAGVLPANDDQPWTAPLNEIRERFAPSHAPRSRLDAWRSCAALVALFENMFAGPEHPVEWWLHGEFVTAAVECTQLELAVLVPERGLNAMDGVFQDLLERLVRPGVTEAAYNAHIELVFVDRVTEVEQLEADLQRVRQLCGRNRVDEGRPVVEAGWVALL